MSPPEIISKCQSSRKLMHAGYQERFLFDDIGRKRVVERQRGRVGAGEAFSDC